MIVSNELLKDFVFEGISKNVTCLGFYDDGRFMYSGGEDCNARIWDLRWVWFTHRLYSNYGGTLIKNP